MNNECVGCERDDVELKGWWAHEYIENGDGTATNALVAQPVLICQTCFEHGVLPENKRGFTWDSLPIPYTPPSHTRYGSLPPWDKES
jgi:hypothetical protein